MDDNKCQKHGWNPVEDCHSCGTLDPSSLSVVESRVSTEPLTEDEEDELVARASMPTLSSLFNKAKKRGLIRPTNSYEAPTA